MVTPWFAMGDPKESDERPASSYLWDAIVKVNTALGGIIALVAGIFLTLWIAKPIPGWVAALVAIPLVLICVALGQALRASVVDAAAKRRELINRLTANQAMLCVNQILPPFPPYKHVVCVCLVECEHRLPENSHVTFVVKAGEVERPLGSGTVRVRQENGKTQITLDHVHDESDPEVQAVRENKDGATSRLYVTQHFTTFQATSLPAPTPSEGPSLGPTVGPRALPPKDEVES